LIFPSRLEVSGQFACREMAGVVFADAIGGIVHGHAAGSDQVSCIFARHGSLLSGANRHPSRDPSNNMDAQGPRRTHPTAWRDKARRSAKLGVSYVTSL
jgi:hypothetical protein